MSNSRRSALKTMAAVAVTGTAVAQHVHDAGPLLQVATNAKPANPVFFTRSELDLLRTLVDLIIPKTDSPGAAEAGVPAIIDRSLKSSERAKGQWRAALKWFNDEMQKPGANHLAILQKGSDDYSDISRQGKSPASDFFVLLKGATVDAYYATREGLQTELGWNANTYLSEFKGCTHPEHQS